MMHPRRAARFLLLIAISLVVMITLAAPLVTLLLFGAKYYGSIPVLQILIWATVPMYWNFVLNSQLIARSADRAILYAAIIALAINVTLNLLLIPKYGYLACAGVTLATEFALLGTNIYFVRRIGVIPWPENLGRLIVTTILVAGFCICWTRAGYGPIGTALLILAIFSFPVFRSDFLESEVPRRAGNTTPVTRIVG